MCGIVGSTHPEECPPELMARMLGLLSQRGPDGEGTWRDARMVLGHRRLSILDPTDRGAQPMHSADGKIHIIYNGEFYNHLEIRRQLPPRQWQSTCDTETLLALYEAHGRDFVHHVNGMFAIAIYDERENKLLLYRDRLGIKPLYYAHTGEFLAFASTLRPLLLHPRVSREIDPDALRDYFLFNYVAGEQSILRDVKRLEPGHCIEFNLSTGEFQCRAWWKASDHLVLNDTHSSAHREDVLSQKTEELETLILDAVKLRTLSDVPLGCFLSGGIDSSTVAWALTKSTNGAVKTFNIGFEQAAYDESAYARRVARHLGTEHHTRTFTRRECLEVVHNIGGILDEPIADASILPTLILSQMTRQHVTVSLSGDGGDELFLGYDRYAWAEQVRRRLQFIPNTLRRGLASAAAALPHYKLQMVANSLKYGNEKEIYPYLFAGWNQPFVNSLLRRGDNFSRHPIHSIYRSSRLSPMRAAGFTDVLHYLPDDILAKVDKASMHHSLEVRVPLLDYRIVQFALSLPQWMNYDGRGQKLLLKRVLFRHVPPALFRRPKMGFAVPLHRWLRGSLAPLVKENLLDAQQLRHGLFDTSAIRDIVMRHQSGRYNHERQLWALLTFQLWYRSITP